MAAKSNYLKNKLIDWLWRAQSYSPVSPFYVSLLTSTTGARQNSHAYTSGDTLSLTGNDGKTHLYKVTTSGTSASSQSTLYPGTPDEVITDGTAVMTEQTSVLAAAGSTLVEVSGGSFARVAVTPSLANMAGTQSAGSTTTSSGTGGTTSNNSSITFASPTANWGFIWGSAIFDALTSGNLLTFGGLTTVKTVNNGDAAPSFAAGALTIQDDNA
jgi:hypothetical protein